MAVSLATCMLCCVYQLKKVNQLSSYNPTTYAKKMGTTLAKQQFSRRTEASHNMLLARMFKVSSKIINWYAEELSSKQLVLNVYNFEAKQ